MAWEKKDMMLSMFVYEYFIKEIDKYVRKLFHDDILLNIFKHTNNFQISIFNTYYYKWMTKSIKIERMNDFDEKLFHNKIYIVNKQIHTINTSMLSYYLLI